MQDRVEADDEVEPFVVDKATEMVGEILDPGDTITGKMSMELDLEIGRSKTSAWVTYGVTSSIRPGEDEYDAYERVSTVIAARLLNLADDTERRLVQETRAAKGM